MLFRDFDVLAVVHPTCELVGFIEDSFNGCVFNVFWKIRFSIQNSNDVFNFNSKIQSIGTWLNSTRNKLTTANFLSNWCNLTGEK